MISPKIKMEIFRHAQDVYPNESCGLVTQKSRVQKYHRIDNVHDEPEKHFKMDTNQYVDVIDDESRELIAIVHSHTGDGASATPSAHDMSICDEMQVLSIIVSLPEGDMSINEPKDRPLIGRPWALGSFDCWGLIMAYHKQHGISLGDFRVDFEWWHDGGLDLYQSNYLKEGFVPIEDQKNPRPGDMVIMQLASEVWNHAGVYMGNNQILHHTSGKLSRCDIYSGWWQNHTVMICRHKDLK
ncbi:MULTISPECIES: C40 family peptidase [Gammaproteobacteria]|uniref:C40 family peptidase n=1 Tax=Gammaproteobacteria TaxID=1236 RepID=UPI002FC936D3